MSIKEYIERIIDNGNIEDMHTLSEILEDLMSVTKRSDEKMYKKYEMEFYKMAYGSNLNREMAEEIVHNMTPYGMKWTIEDTREIQQEYGINNIRDIDFFVVMNSAYNDYRDIFNDNIEMYIRFSNDFIKDEDARQDKVFLYFTTIPNN